MSETTIDLSQIEGLAEHLGAIADEAFAEVDAVVSKGALNVKQELVADILGSKHFKGAAGSITYDAHNTRDTSRREIGPDKSRRGGALGNIYYFGTSRGGGTGDIDKPLTAEEPRFVDAVNKLVERWAAQI